MKFPLQRPYGVSSYWANAIDEPWNRCAGVVPKKGINCDGTLVRSLGAERPDFNLTEFRARDPFDIAEQYFTTTLQTEMDDTLKEMLHAVIQEVREEETL